MNACGHSVESLQAEIAELGTALAQDQLERMPQMLVEHDLHLKQYCEQADIPTVRDELKRLNAMQQELIRMMRQRQIQIQALMRGQRHSRRAAAAYSSSGFL